MIKMIAFDCWGTLFGNAQHPHPLEVFANKIGKTLEDREYLQEFEAALMTAPYTDLKPPILKLLQNYDIEYDTPLLMDLEAIMVGVIHTQVVFPETIEVLTDLKHEYKLSLATNTHQQGYEGLCKQFDLSQYFDVMITSFQEGFTKPDPRIFAALIQKARLDPSEIVFVGDSLESDIKPALAAGMKPVLIDRRGRYPNIWPRIKTLRELTDHL